MDYKVSSKVLTTIRTRSLRDIIRIRDTDGHISHASDVY